MQGNAVDLGVNVTGTANATTLSSGGRYNLVLSATGYGTTVSLQTLARDGVTWITMNGTTYSANGVYPLDLHPGQYRMFMNGGTTTALYATLAKVTY